MRDRLQEANVWIQEVKERCQPREGPFSDTSAVHAGPDSLLPFNRPSAPTVRRKGKEKDKDKTEEKGRSKGGERNSVTPPLPALSVSQALTALLQAGKALKIEVTKEVTQLEDTLEAIERWNTQTSSALLSLDSQHLAPLVLEYRLLLQRDSQDIKVECDLAVQKPDLQLPDSHNTPCGVTMHCESGWSRFPCTEGLCGPPTVPPLDECHLSPTSIRVTVEGDMEDKLWKALLHFYAEMQLLSDKAAELGIWAGSSDGAQAGFTYSSFLQLELCQASIRWIDEARALMCYPLELNHNISLRVPQEGRTHSTSASYLKVKETMNKDKDRDTVVVAASARSDSAPTSEAPSTSEKKKVSRKQKGEAPVLPSADSAVAADTPEPSAELVHPCWGDCSRCVCSRNPLHNNVSRVFDFSLNLLRLCHIIDSSTLQSCSDGADTRCRDVLRLHLRLEAPRSTAACRTGKAVTSEQRNRPQLEWNAAQHIRHLLSLILITF